MKLTLCAAPLAAQHPVRRGPEGWRDPAVGASWQSEMTAGSRHLGRVSPGRPDRSAACRLSQHATQLLAFLWGELYPVEWRSGTHVDGDGSGGLGQEPGCPVESMTSCAGLSVARRLRTASPQGKSSLPRGVSRGPRQGDVARDRVFWRASTASAALPAPGGA